MSVDIGQVIEEGGKRTVARNGLVLVAVAWVLGILNSVFSNTITAFFIRQLPDARGPGPGPAAFAQSLGPSLDLPPSVAGILWVTVVLMLVVVTAGATRTFVTDDTERLPGERFTRNLVWMLLNLVVGGIVFGFIVGIGFVGLAVVGWLLQTLLGGGVVTILVIALGFLAAIVLAFYLLVSLFFWNVYVIVEDQNFVEAFQNSWALTDSNRLILFILGVVVVIIVAVVGGIFGVVTAILPGIVGLAIAQIGSAFTSMFAVATAARTYLQLTNAETSAA